jgi:hypothetical protein
VANQFLNTSWVSMEILRLLLNQLVAAEYFNRSWEKDFNKEFAPGSSVTIKFPWRPTVTDGMGYDPQGIARLSTTISLDQWLQIGFEWDDYEKAVKLERSEEELRENYWDPCAAAMAQEIDSRCANFAYQNASNVVGVLGTDPTSVSTYYSAQKIMKQQACPPGKRCALISSSMMASLGSNITSVFHPDDEIVRMWKEGSIGKLAGFSFFESNSLYAQTAGTWASTVTVTGANQSGTALIITGTSGDTIMAGDKISAANVNAVNPMTRRTAGPLTAKTFTIAQNYTLVRQRGHHPTSCPPSTAPAASTRTWTPCPSMARRSPCGPALPRLTARLELSVWHYPASPSVWSEASSTCPRQWSNPVRRKTPTLASPCARSRPGTRCGVWTSTAWTACWDSATCTRTTAPAA